jgi:hypothetical protein
VSLLSLRSVTEQMPHSQLAMPDPPRVQAPRTHPAPTRPSCRINKRRLLAVSVAVVRRPLLSSFPSLSLHC